MIKEMFTLLKVLSKSLVIMMTIVFSFAVFSTSMSQSAHAAGGEWVNLGKGYKARFDEPHDKKTGKWHVHVYNGKKEIASENMDGTSHDGSHLSKAPKSAVKKLKSTSQWKKYKKKENQLSEARKQVHKKSWWQMVIDPTPLIVLAAALGIAFKTLTMFQWKAIVA